MIQKKFLVITIVLILFSACLFGFKQPISADVRLPHVIGSRMVLQRDISLPIWGWADPNENVTVKIGENEFSTQASKEGDWKVELPPMKAGGPFSMTVSGKNTIQLTDILIGEVWICSGQSNMQVPLSTVFNTKQEIAQANYPGIRLFHVPRIPAGQPVSDIDTEWLPCSSENFSEFSATAYFFGRDLHKELGVPVGLINSSWGGTYIEPWTSYEGFKQVPELTEFVERIDQDKNAYRNSLGESLDEVQEWIKESRKALKSGEEIPLQPEWPEHPLDSHRSPSGLYNGMIHPIIPYAIRGAIWYQGESNRREGMLYFDKTKALIGGWRKAWNQGDFPFLYVQLAPCRYGKGNYHHLPGMWEGQTACLAIPNTGMVVTTDIGDVTYVHPLNKQDVGKRLSLWALAKAYGRDDLVYSGPFYKSMAVSGNKIVISFDHTGSGLKSADGKPLNWFTIAGANQKFVKAHAEIEGDTVVVWSEKIDDPVAVRFGWHEEAEPNLMNKENLPASPFRTDKW